MKTKTFLIIVATYYIIYSVLNLCSLIYTLFYRSIAGLEILIVIIALVYLFGIIITGIKVINGSIRAINVLKISVLIQILFFQIGGFLFEIQNGAALNLYIFFHQGVIRYGGAIDYLRFALQGRITGNPINYIAINVVPLAFSLSFFFVNRRQLRER